MRLLYQPTAADLVYYTTQPPSPSSSSSRGVGADGTGAGDEEAASRPCLQRGLPAVDVDDAVGLDFDADDDVDANVAAAATIPPAPIPPPVAAVINASAAPLPPATPPEAMGLYRHEPCPEHGCASDPSVDDDSRCLVVGSPVSVALLASPQTRSRTPLRVGEVVKSCLKSGGGGGGGGGGSGGGGARAGRGVAECGGHTNSNTKSNTYYIDVNNTVHPLALLTL
jgi:hypothetical protein